MKNVNLPAFRIRKVRADEYAKAGALVADVYASLEGMPNADEQPEYYGMLRDVGKRMSNPSITVFAAVDDRDSLVGCIDFIDDAKDYGSGGTAGSVPDAAGIRLLAVSPTHRKMGIGRALTQFCIERARELGRSKVILHTTRAMPVAWKMYERMGFARYPEIDFEQGRLQVFGFSLSLKR